MGRSCAPPPLPCRSPSRPRSRAPCCRASRASATPAVSSSRTDQLLEIVMPQLGISVTEGTLLEWRKQPGDHIEADETICEVSTDKIDSEIPAPRSGRIVELLVEAGATVEVGTVIATLAAEDAPAGPSSAEGAGVGAAAPGAPA